MGSRKVAQTSTEYLIIVAIVIVIATIVVSILGGIPGIGGKTGQSTDLLSAQNKDIGILSVVTTTYGTSFILRNNLPQTVELLNISLNGIPCHVNAWDGANGTGILPKLSKKLTPGETLELTCQAFRSSSASTLTGTVSDDVYDTGWAADTKPAYLGNLANKPPGEEITFAVSFEFTNTETGGTYVSQNATLVSTVAESLGYKGLNR